MLPLLTNRAAHPLYMQKRREGFFRERENPHVAFCPDQALERAVWPELVPRRSDSWSANDVIGPITALLALACFLAPAGEPLQ